MIRIAILAEFPIGTLSGEMLGRGGGHAATWLPQLAKTWEQVGDCEIHWCILDRTATEHSAISKWNQTFHRIPFSGITVGMMLARWPQRLAYRRLFREIRPDLIHCWGTETLHGSALWEFDGPSILSMQGVVSAYMKTGDLKGWRWKLFERWESSSIRKATVITSESQWGIDRVAEVVAGKHAEKIEYGVFPSYYDIQWDPAPDRPRILFAGGLNRLKGVDILLEMLKRHPTREWKMVFAGSGYLGSELQALNSQNVEILGNLTTAQVQEQMAQAWALVIPSRADTSPNVVKEARVIGLPVVGSPHGGHAEYIEDGINGRVIDSDQPDAWFEALDLVAHDLPLCQRMGSVHQSGFRKYFRPEETALKFLELYRTLGKR